MPALARQYATVTAEVEVTSDPRLTRPRITGDHTVPTAVVIGADIRRVETADGRAVVTRAPVLLIVDARAGTGAGAQGARGAPPAVEGPARSPWLGLLPSTRVRVTARAAPTLTGGDRVAAVLRVRDRGGPEVVGEASGTQRFAGRLREGLREATDGLPADARALLPGLVVGDTSRITPELDEAFKETDLAHTLAVSGSNLTILLALLIGPPGLAQLVERRGLAPRLGASLRTTALLGGGLTLGFVVVCPAGPERAAGRGLRGRRVARSRDRTPQITDPGAGHRRTAAGAVRPVAGPQLRLSALRAGHRRPAHARAALEPGVAPAPHPGTAGGGVGRRGRRAGPVRAGGRRPVGAGEPGGGALQSARGVRGRPGHGARLRGAGDGTRGDAGGQGAGLVRELARRMDRERRPDRGVAARRGVDWPGSWTGAGLLALVTGLLLLVGRRLLRHPWWCAVCAMAFVLAVVQPPPLTRVITGWPPPDWRLAMCDVGQGDAVVLAAGEGTGVVVDAGPDPGLVDDCLRTLGVTEVPLVVLTHFHADHVAGLAGVLRGGRWGRSRRRGSRSRWTRPRRYGGRRPLGAFR